MLMTLITVWLITEKIQMLQHALFVEKKRRLKILRIKSTVAVSARLYRLVVNARTTSWFV